MSPLAWMARLAAPEDVLRALALHAGPPALTHPSVLAWVAAVARSPSPATSAAAESFAAMVFTYARARIIPPASLWSAFVDTAPDRIAHWRSRALHASMTPTSINTHDAADVASERERAKHAAGELLLRCLRSADMLAAFLRDEPSHSHCVARLVEQLVLLADADLLPLAELGFAARSAAAASAAPLPQWLSAQPQVARALHQHLWALLATPTPSATQAPHSMTLDLVLALWELWPAVHADEQLRSLADTGHGRRLEDLLIDGVRAVAGQLSLADLARLVRVQHVQSVALDQELMDIIAARCASATAPVSRSGGGAGDFWRQADPGHAVDVVRFLVRTHHAAVMTDTVDVLLLVAVRQLKNLSLVALGKLLWCLVQLRHVARDRANRLLALDDMIAGVVGHVSRRAGQTPRLGSDGRGWARLVVASVSSGTLPSCVRPLLELARRQLLNASVMSTWPADAVADVVLGLVMSDLLGSTELDQVLQAVRARPDRLTASDLVVLAKAVTLCARADASNHFAWLCSSLAPQLERLSAERLVDVCFCLAAAGKHEHVSLAEAASRLLVPRIDSLTPNAVTLLTRSLDQLGVRSPALHARLDELRKEHALAEQLAASAAHANENERL
jgi:hypothetical protein